MRYDLGFKKTSTSSTRSITYGADEGSQTPVTALARPYSSRWTTSASKLIISKLWEKSTFFINFIIFSV